MQKVFQREMCRLATWKFSYIVTKPPKVIAPFGPNRSQDPVYNAERQGVTQGFECHIEIFENFRTLQALA